jgi:hypothetical protein
MDLTPKQQASEAIRQANTILVTTGQHPSVDQVAAVLALAAILRKQQKKVTAIISDTIPVNLDFMPVGDIDKDLAGLRDFILQVDLSRSEVDSLKYTVEGGKLNINLTPFKGGFEPRDVTFAYGSYHYDIAIVVGVPTRARLDRVFTQNPELLQTVPLINIDFHRSNEQYGAVNLIDGQAASLSEMLVALSESLQGGMIDENIATILLAGIIASTDRFTATHTTAKALTVAAQMMAAGAKQQTIVKALYRSNDNRAKPAERPDRRPNNNPQPNKTLIAGGSVKPTPKPEDQPAPTEAPVETMTPTEPPFVDVLADVTPALDNPDLYRPQQIEVAGEPLDDIIFPTQA